MLVRLHERGEFTGTILVARDGEEKGVDTTIAVYHRLRTIEPHAYDFTQGELNRLGYTLLGTGDVSGAVQVFELNAQPDALGTFVSGADIPLLQIARPQAR